MMHTHQHTDARPVAGSAATVERVVARDDGTIVTTDDVEEWLPARVDRDRARRWLRTVRRVDRVDLHVDAEAAWCVVRGRSHRLPFERRVPLAVGLGLCDLGVRTTLTTSTPSTSEGRR